MLRRYRIGRRGGGVDLYVKESIQADEINLDIVLSSQKCISDKVNNT